MATINQSRQRLRRKAQNFPTKPAQARINEHLDPFRDKIENALNIDSVEVVVFKRIRSGIPCTCSKHLVTAEATMVGGAFEGFAAEPETAVRIAPKGSTMVIDVGDDNLFGEALYQNSIKPRELELGDIAPNSVVNTPPEDSDTHYSGEIFVGTDLDGGRMSCGVCYGEGFVPAFDAVNYAYTILSFHNTCQVEGYSIDQAESPNVFRRVHDNGFVEFELVVPKYFVNATFSIRNNVDVMPGYDRLFTVDDIPLSMAYLESKRGQVIRLRVSTPEFTHAVLVFKLNEYEIRANLSTENEVINYENEVTIGDMNVIMSNRSGSVRSEDLLVAPKRNLVMKINSAPRKSTADKELWQWVFTARAVQRSEPTAKIFKMYKVY